MKSPKRDPVREDHIHNEAIVDASPDEQAMSWYYYLESKISFPFQAKCLASAWPQTRSASTTCSSWSGGRVERWPSLSLNSPPSIQTDQPLKPSVTGITGSRRLLSLITHAHRKLTFDFKIADRPVQVHSFGSQGFAYSNNNNYLTMDTSKGTLALTDFGFNASTRINDNFRVGAQFYDRNVGRLGNWKPELDWAVADYRFKDWFGVRAGKVKTVVGLCNDTQDMELLHTWALMPQSTYPVDVRGDTIAHVGADLYGNIAIKRLGSVSYTLYGGTRLNDSQGGYLYGLSTSSRVADPNGGFQYITSQTKKGCEQESAM